MSTELLSRLPADWDLLFGKPLLRVHAALIMGIVDPLPMPSPMSEEEGAWVRENAWTPGLRLIEAEYPYGYHRWCRCQHGTCWNCLAKRCDLCVHRQSGAPSVDDHAGVVTDARGMVRAAVLHRDGQRPCRWTCACPCPKTGPAPQRPTRRRRAAPQKAKKQRAATPSHAAQPAVSEDQLDLLGALP